MKTKLLLFVLFASVIGWFGCTHLNTNINSDTLRGVASSDDLGPAWAFDPGPDPKTQMGQELIDIVADQPNMPDLSLSLTGRQKFRPAFGPTLWRMIQKPNSVKILFIGQDGTHIAEAAGRTATAGFGGRAQDLAAYFGVSTGAAFMNAFAYTISGQYAAYGTPVISGDEQNRQVSFMNVVDNGTWLMSQDPSSPMVKWRNRLIDWIMRNNKDSLKLVVVFGGAAQDSMATFIQSHGGKVGSYYSAAELKTRKIKVPQINLKYAGGNNVFPVPLNTNGTDFYQMISNKSLDYKNPKDQELAQKNFSEQLNQNIDKISFSAGGVEGSGLFHPAQIKGYSLDQIYINGERTLSLKGLKLSDGSQITQDVLVTDLPHPTYLSNLVHEGQDKAAASKLVARSLAHLEPYVKKGWSIPADENFVNYFSKGDPYRYGRTDIPYAFYDFGTPKNRMVSVSSASRMTGNANVVIIGTRERPDFDMNRINEMTYAKPAAGVSPLNMYIARPRSLKEKNIFDRGPSEKMARLMKENLDINHIGQLKSGFSKDDGIAAYNIKSHPEEVGDFGHYRGKFEKYKVIILADPDGFDDILTSRALTGTRGQYLQSLMNNMDVTEDYLVIKTVPFAMDGASEQEWSTVLNQTATYREKIFTELLKPENTNNLKLILTDGPQAAKVMKHLVGAAKIPIVNIQRNQTESDVGIKEAAVAIKQLKIFPQMISNKIELANIPRSHLGFMSRVWEGTSGSHVLNARSTADMGKAFAIVAPAWAFEQKNINKTNVELKSIQQMNLLQKNLKLSVNPKIPLEQLAVQLLDEETIEEENTQNDIITPDMMPQQ